MSIKFLPFITLLSSTFLASLASAHVSVTNKLYSNSYSQIELAVPHGCEGFDTVKIEVTLPEGLTGVRPLNSVFGAASIEKNDANVITKITWVADAALPYASDSHAYSFAIRAKTPDAAFKTLYFPTIQTCMDIDGNTYTAEWVGTESHDHSAESAVKPAPSALLYPKVSPGWNKFVVNEHVHDLSVFNDAEIVWLGKAAYSGNPNTLKMINDDPDATVLDLIHPGSEIWVKY